MTSPLERYHLALDEPGMVEDAPQLEVAERLDVLYRQLSNLPAQSSPGVFPRLFSRQPALFGFKGLYIWGGVGRGKTFLVDLFFECLSFPQKKRTHFHRFMKKVHEELKGLRDREDPLSLIADRYAAQFKVLCFDEFVVNDIADAMILHGLLKHLYAKGVTLVATSNIHPDDLYEDGLQRDRFLPAIELIKEHCDVVELTGDKDYRLEFLEQAEIYLVPHDDSAHLKLMDAFAHIAPEPGSENQNFEIGNRNIPTLRIADGVIWFSFTQLCGGPRSSNDYIEIASCFHSVVLSDIPAFSAEMDDEARRFINLIDVLYDHNVSLVASAAAEPDMLYRATRLAEEFKRTASRLAEMQSHQYLARQHRTD